MLRGRRDNGHKRGATSRSKHTIQKHKTCSSVPTLSKQTQKKHIKMPTCQNHSAITPHTSSQALSHKLSVAQSVETGLQMLSSATLFHTARHLTQRSTKKGYILSMNDLAARDMLLTSATRTFHRTIEHAFQRFVHRIGTLHRTAKRMHSTRAHNDDHASPAHDTSTTPATGTSKNAPTATTTTTKGKSKKSTTDTSKSKDTSSHPTTTIDTDRGVSVAGIRQARSPTPHQVIMAEWLHEEEIARLDGPNTNTLLHGIESLPFQLPLMSRLHVPSQGLVQSVNRHVNSTLRLRHLAKNPDSIISDLEDAPLAAKLLVKAGLITRLPDSQQYIYLPFAMRVLDKLSHMVQEEVNLMGIQKIDVPSMIEKPSLYTYRMRQMLLDQALEHEGITDNDLTEQQRRELHDKIDDSLGLSSALSPFYRLYNINDAELVITPSLYEYYTQIVKQTVKTSKQLPLAFYTHSKQFRDINDTNSFISRATNIDHTNTAMFTNNNKNSKKNNVDGLLIGSEYHAISGVTYHADDNSAHLMYKTILEAYKRIFKKLNIQGIQVEADGADLGCDLTHEYHIPLPPSYDSTPNKPRRTNVPDGQLPHATHALVQCGLCSYAANTQKADFEVDPKFDQQAHLSRIKTGQVSYTMRNDPRSYGIFDAPTQHKQDTTRDGALDRQIRSKLGAMVKLMIPTLARRDIPIVVNVVRLNYHMKQGDIAEEYADMNISDNDRQFANHAIVMLRADRELNLRAVSNHFGCSDSSILSASDSALFLLRFQKYKQKKYEAAVKENPQLATEENGNIFNDMRNKVLEYDDRNLDKLVDDASDTTAVQRQYAAIRRIAAQRDVNGGLVIVCDNTLISHGVDVDDPDMFAPGFLENENKDRTFAIPDKVTNGSKSLLEAATGLRTQRDFEEKSPIPAEFANQFEVILQGIKRGILEVGNDGSLVLNGAQHVLDKYPEFSRDLGLADGTLQRDPNDDIENEDPSKTIQRVTNAMKKQLERERDTATGSDNDDYDGSDGTEYTDSSDSDLSSSSHSTHKKRRARFDDIFESIPDDQLEKMGDTDLEEYILSHGLTLDDVQLSSSEEYDGPEIYNPDSFVDAEHHDIDGDNYYEKNNDGMGPEKIITRPANRHGEEIEYDVTKGDKPRHPFIKRSAVDILQEAAEDYRKKRPHMYNEAPEINEDDDNIRMYQDADGHYVDKDGQILPHITADLRSERDVRRAFGKKGYDDNDDEYDTMNPPQDAQYDDIDSFARDKLMTAINPGQGQFSAPSRGDKCIQAPCNGQGILEGVRSIEIGKIYYHGNTLTRDTDATIITDSDKTGRLDSDGYKEVPYYMTSFKIGLTRLMNAIVESVGHDQHGIIWPEFIAPYQVAIAIDPNSQINTTKKRIARVNEYGEDAWTDADVYDQYIDQAALASEAYESMLEDQRERLTRLRAISDQLPTLRDTTNTLIDQADDALGETDADIDDDSDDENNYGDDGQKMTKMRFGLWDWGLADNHSHALNLASTVAKHVPGLESDILYDDRHTLSLDERVTDLYRIGIPWIIVIDDLMQQKGLIKVINRRQGTSEHLSVDQVVHLFSGQRPLEERPEHNRTEFERDMKYRVENALMAHYGQKSIHGGDPNALRFDDKPNAPFDYNADVDYQEYAGDVDASDKENDDNSTGNGDMDLAAHPAKTDFRDIEQDMLDKANNKKKKNKKNNDDDNTNDIIALRHELEAGQNSRPDSDRSILSRQIAEPVDEETLRKRRDTVRKYVDSAISGEYGQDDHGDDDLGETVEIGSDGKAYITTPQQRAIERQKKRDEVKEIVNFDPTDSDDDNDDNNQTDIEGQKILQGVLGEGVQEEIIRQEEEAELNNNDATRWYKQIRKMRRRLPPPSSLELDRMFKAGILYYDKQRNVRFNTIKAVRFPHVVLGVTPDAVLDYETGNIRDTAPGGVSEIRDADDVLSDQRIITAQRIEKELEDGVYFTPDPAHLSNNKISDPLREALRSRENINIFPNMSTRLEDYVNDPDAYQKLQFMNKTNEYFKNNPELLQQITTTLHNRHDKAQSETPDTPIAFDKRFNPGQIVEQHKILKQQFAQQEQQYQQPRTNQYVQQNSLGGFGSSFSGNKAKQDMYAQQYQQRASQQQQQYPQYQEAQIISPPSSSKSSLFANKMDRAELSPEEMRQEFLRQQQEQLNSIGRNIFPKGASQSARRSVFQSQQQQQQQQPPAYSPAYAPKRSLGSVFSDAPVRNGDNKPQHFENPLMDPRF